jgi:NADPH:quinone reductase-like Zn-dependent oxidoreductase
MKAVRLYEYGGPENLKFEDNVPEPQVGGDTVLIAAAAASVNPIDWKVRAGLRQKDFPLSLPAILGRDVSGIVRAVGSNVKHFKPGDRVLAFTNATYAELVAVDDSDVTHLPDGLDLVDAAALPLIVLTGDQLVRLATNVQKGQVVLVTGALGSVGRAAVHAAKKIGAQVIAGVRRKELDDARALGVSGVLALDDDEAMERFQMVDAIADTVGGDVAARLLVKVKPGGSFVRTFQKHRDSLCMLTTGPNGSLYETQDSSGSEPSSWNVAQIATLCGATSVWGDSSGEDWFVWASDTGLRAYEGGEVFKISQEVQTLWDSITTPQNTVVVNDPVTRRIYVLVTVGTVRTTYVLDYRELNTAAAIDGSGPIKVSYSGRVLSTDVVRKWTTWTGAATFGGLLILPGGSSQMCFTGANVYKLLNDQQGIDDDTGPFLASYTTYAFTGTDNERSLQLGMHRKLFAYVALSTSGKGQIRLVPLAESLTNSWATTPWLPLELSSMFDVECGLNVLATRCFFRIEGQPLTAGGPSFWIMSKMIFSVRPDALIPVRGAF